MKITENKFDFENFILSLTQAQSISDLLSLFFHELKAKTFIKATYFFTCKHSKELTLYLEKEKNFKQEVVIETVLVDFFANQETFINDIDLPNNFEKIINDFSSKNFLLLRVSSKAKYNFFYLLEISDKKEILKLEPIFNLFSTYLDNMFLSKKIAKIKYSLPNKKLAIIDEIIRNILNTLNITDLATFLIKHLTYELNFERVFLFCESPNSSYWQIFIGKEYNKENFNITLLEQNEQEQTESILNSLKKHPSLENVIDNNTFFSVPVFSKNKLIGFIGVDSCFSKKEIDTHSKELIEELALQISTSIENALLYTEIQNSALGFKHLFEITSSFNTLLDYEQAAKNIIIKIATAISVTQGYLISFEVNSYCRIIATTDDDNDWLDKTIELSPPLKQAIVSKQIGLYDFRQNPRFKCLDLKYALIVPMYIKNKLTGILCLGEVSENQERIFTPSDIKLVERLVSQALITLENAQLYSRLEDMVIERTYDLIESNKELFNKKEKLESVNKKLQDIITSIPHGILVIDRDDIIVNSNLAFTNIIRVFNKNIKVENSLNGLSIKKLIRLISEDDSNKKKALIELLNSILQKKDSERIETEIIIENGHIVYYKVITAIVKENSTMSYLENETENEKYNQIVIFHDITKEKEIDKMKSDLMAVVSHELKTPVSAMTGFASLIEDGIAGDVNIEQLEYLRKIQIQGERLIRLINDLLDFSKLEAGQMPMHMQLLDPYETIFEVVEVLRPLADEKNIQIVYNVNDVIPNIYVDPDKLKQIFINLISNAIKFTPENTGLIELNAELLENKIIEFSVKDNGIGISEKDKIKLFDSFYQADNTSTRKYGGTGLGLSIAKKLVELNNGKIWFESQVGKGTTFYFTIPVTESP